MSPQALEAKEQHPWRRLRLMIQSPVFTQYKQRVQKEQEEEEELRRRLEEEQADQEAPPPHGTKL